MFAFIGVDQLIEKSTESLSFFIFPLWESCWMGGSVRRSPAGLFFFGFVCGKYSSLGCMQ